MNEILKSFYKGFRLNKNVLSLIDKTVHTERLRKVHDQLKRVLRDPILLPYEKYQDTLLIKKRVRLFNIESAELGNLEYVWDRVSLSYVEHNPTFIFLDNIFSYSNNNGVLYIWKRWNKILSRKEFKNNKNLRRYELYHQMWESLKRQQYLREIEYPIYGFNNTSEALGYQW